MKNETRDSANLAPVENAGIVGHGDLEIHLDALSLIFSLDGSHVTYMPERENLNDDEKRVIAQANDFIFFGTERDYLIQLQFEAQEAGVVEDVSIEPLIQSKETTINRSWIDSQLNKKDLEPSDYVIVGLWTNMPYNLQDYIPTTYSESDVRVTRLTHVGRGNLHWYCQLLCVNA